VSGETTSQLHFKNYAPMQDSLVVYPCRPWGRRLAHAGFMLDAGCSMLDKTQDARSKKQSSSSRGSGALTCKLAKLIEKHAHRKTCKTLTCKTCKTCKKEDWNHRRSCEYVRVRPNKNVNSLPTATHFHSDKIPTIRTSPLGLFVFIFGREDNPRQSRIRSLR
jgi:hypothetical protein